MPKRNREKVKLVSIQNPKKHQKTTSVATLKLSKAEKENQAQAYLIAIEKGQAILEKIIMMSREDDDDDDV